MRMHEYADTSMHAVSVDITSTDAQTSHDATLQYQARPGQNGWCNIIMLS